MKKKKNCGFIATMNASEEIMEAIGISKRIDTIAQALGMSVGICETLYACDTYQFKDYSKYYAGAFDEKAKAKQREEQFPIDMKKAYDMGFRIANEPCKGTISIAEFIEHEIKKNKTV